MGWVESPENLRSFGKQSESLYGFNPFSFILAFRKKPTEMAQMKMESITDNQLERNSTLELIIERIKSFSTIEKAWVYGSFARGDDGPKSDRDIALKTSLDFSYFDLAEVQYQLEQQTNRKIDVGFLDSSKPYIFEHVKPDLKLIYERRA